MTSPTVASTSDDPSHDSTWIQITLVAVAFTIIVIYLLVTPAGLLAKADMIGYAICHRIPSHSLLVNERPLPLCARCTGTYLGAMVTLFGLFLFRRRATELPPLPVLLTLIGFTGLMGLDGINSYLTLIPGRTPFYPPSNMLRLVTGTLNGLMMGSILYPVAMGAFWRRPGGERSLKNLRELGLLVLVALSIAGLTRTGWPAVLFPLALISAGGVPIMLTLVNSVIVIILLRRENRATRWRDLLLPLVIAFALSMLMIGAIDFARYQLTGTLQGLPGLGA